MIYKAYKIYLFVSLLLCLAAKGQRVYRVASVLSSGVWSKISLKDPGVYKADVAFLSALGFNTTNLSSSSIRLFGNGGGMLSEANADIPMDDLGENAIMLVDGGDGIFNAGFVGR